MRCHHQTPSSRHRDRRELEMMDESKEIMSSRYNRIDAYIKTQRLWQHTQGLYRFKPQGFQLKGKWLQGPSPVMKQFSARKGKIDFLQWRFIEYINYSPGRPMLRNSQLTQKEHHRNNIKLGRQAGGECLRGIMSGGEIR